MHCIIIQTWICYIIKVSIIYETICVGFYTCTCISFQFLPIAVAKVRNAHSHCPKEVLSFIMDIIKFSDNESNQVQYTNMHVYKLCVHVYLYMYVLQCALLFQYHDGYYRAALVDALGAYITPPIAVIHQNK